MVRASRLPSCSSTVRAAGTAAPQGRFGWLALLLLLCLIPRAFMAWKIGGCVTTAPMYIEVAKSLDQGQLHEDKYNRFGLNLFPVILMLLHRSGLDWELAGKFWNVAISCLTVLPLYGWVRRQFDDRLALVPDACMPYIRNSSDRVPKAYAIPRFGSA